MSQNELNKTIESNPNLTDFQKKCYKTLLQVPEWTVVTYKELAEMMNTKAIRAVGSALAKNPYAPHVPCHRVIRSDGSLGNYSAQGWVERKKELLLEEWYTWI